MDNYLTDGRVVQGPPTVFQIEIQLHRTVGLNVVKSIGHFGLLSEKV